VRLGLVSPGKQEDEEERASRPLSRQGSEQDSTVGASSEQEWTNGSVSEQESAGDSEKEDGAAKPAPCEPDLPPGLDGLAIGRPSVGIELPPGLGLPKGIPSLGSVLHATGSCQPCSWFWKKAGCSNGQTCGFCHLCPDGTAKPKHKTSKRWAKA